MSKYIAHSQNNAGEAQTLLQHSQGVADLMRSFSLSKEYEDLFAFCGLAHDIGKYSSKFQDYINGCGNGEPHAVWGAYYAVNNELINLAFPIFGHHIGLPNNGYMRERVESCENSKWIEIEQAIKDDGFNISLPDNTPFCSLGSITQQELFVRFLYSALVDADSLDTERHFLPDSFLRREHMDLDVDNLINCLTNKFSGFKSDTYINKLRTDVRLYAESMSSLPLGCYSMTLPTGMGKTLCSINWALHHAKAHQSIKRIIIVLPYISIIDQTAKILKDIFGADTVLEHHSNVIYENPKGEGLEYEKSTIQLATENWDYPIVVTTAVQFFESLFSNKRSKCRKLHNIQDSIIIFDEIQTLPIDLAECTMTMLNDLLSIGSCSVLFCTATQPDFKTRSGFNGIKNIVPLVKDVQDVFEAVKRVEYLPLDNYKEQSFDDIADFAIDLNDSILIVCNTKKKALNLFESINKKSDKRVLHLSTNMCPAHRLRIIDEIKKALNNGEKIIVCSTQLIEAGVDIDFPIVFRELAPLESIIQSAGRCNREGRLGLGKVYLFRLVDKGQPSEQYKTFMSYAQSYYQGNEQRLNDAAFYSQYYKQILALYAKADKITESREELEYENVNGMYHIIDSEASPLFIYNYDENSLKLFHEIKDKEFLNRQDYQRISQYCVNVYDKFKKDNIHKIGITANILIWHGAYTDEFGLSEENEILYI